MWHWWKCFLTIMKKKYIRWLLMHAACIYSTLLDVVYEQMKHQLKCEKVFQINLFSQSLWSFWLNAHSWTNTPFLNKEPRLSNHERPTLSRGIWIWFIRSFMSELSREMLLGVTTSLSLKYTSIENKRTLWQHFWPTHKSTRGRQHSTALESCMSIHILGNMLDIIPVLVHSEVCNFFVSSMTNGFVKNNCFQTGFRSTPCLPIV